MAAISKTMQDAFNEQIKNEVYSAHLYLAMSAWFEAKELPGFAKWMRAQYIEELTHANKMFDYVVDRDGLVTVPAIAQPPAEFASALDIYEKTLEHERHVTELINNLYRKAAAENDYESMTYLQWFLNEQVEEEKNALHIVEQLKAIGNMQGLLIMLDGHMDKRSASLSV